MKEQKEQVLSVYGLIPASEPRADTVLWSQAAWAAEPNKEAENLPDSVPVGSALPDPREGA